MPDFIQNFWNEHSESVLFWGYKLLTTIGIILASIVTNKLLARYIQKTASRFNTMDETITPIIMTLAKYAVYAIAVVIILDLFGVNTTSLIAIMGAAGLAIGLALKDTLSNIAAGLMLIILRPFKVNDFIDADGLMGTITKLGVFVSLLKTPDGVFITVPNSKLWGAPIKNYTRSTQRRVEVEVGISYSDSIDAGFEVLKSIIAEEKRFLAEPLPQIFVKTLADSSINLTLRAWTEGPDYWNTLCDTTKTVKEKIEAAGLSIPFNQLDLHVHKDLA